MLSKIFHSSIHKQFRSKPRSQIIAIFLLAALCISSLPIIAVLAATPAYVTIDPSTSVGANRLSTGFALDSNWRYWLNDADLRELGEDADFGMIRIISSEIEPCSYWDDNTRTGTFNWATVDSVVQRIYQTGAEPLITLIFMDSSGIDLPRGMQLSSTGLPNPSSLAAYCREWVRHFQQAGLPVKYYEVLNEAWYYFYPNWNWNQAKAQNFLTLYNTCYDAMHNQNNQILVGNDASLHRRFLDFWKANGGKLDLLSFHKYDCDNLAMGDNTPLSRAENRYYVSDSYYYGVNDARQLWGGNLPAIASETNWAAFCSQGTDPRLQQVVGSVWLALSLRSAILENVQYNIYYSFSSSKSWEETNKATGGFGFGMINQDDNEPWYPYYVQYMIGHNLAVGDPLLETSSSSSDVRVLSWIHGDTQNTLITCKVDEPRIITIRGLSGQLNLFKIDDNVPYTAPSIQSEQLDANNALIIDGYTVILLQTTVE
jgi:hypothetical protein